MDMETFDEWNLSGLEDNHMDRDKLFPTLSKNPMINGDFNPSPWL